MTHLTTAMTPLSPFSPPFACRGGLSAYALSKLARLHGATVIPRLSKRQVTHVVCSQLSGAKERHAMKDATRIGQVNLAAGGSTAGRRGFSVFFPESELEGSELSREDQCFL